MQKLHQEGYDDLTQFQAELLSYVELNGSRIRLLAQKIGVSKQAISETVLQLVKAGYLLKRTDTEDRRVQLLFFSPKGEQFLFDEHRLKAELEQDYKTLLGRQAFESLQKNLQTLSSQK